MQVNKEDFELALKELGYNPDDYRFKKLSLSGMSKLYDMDEDLILEAIGKKMLQAHYDYKLDAIWIEALDAAYFFYCIKNKVALYTQVA